jgi:hypothetical protein
MTDLDELLADAFEHRATVAGPAVTTQAVHLAIRRQNLRTAKATAVAVVACAALTGTAVLAGARHDRRPVVSGPVRPSVPTPAFPEQDGTIVEELPWAGTIALTLRRGGTAVGTAETPDGYAFCFDASCTGRIAAADPQDFTIGANRGSIYGLAPHGTRKVLVTLGEQTPVSIPVSATDDPTLPGVMYGISSISAVQPGLGSFSLTYRLVAYDWQGQQLAATTVVGSYDLALAHPPVGPLAALPARADDGVTPQQVAWADSSGWSCRGERSAAGASVTFGADVCVPPGDPARVSLVADDPSMQLAVLRVSATVTRMELRGQNGRVVRASFTDTGHGRLATFDLRVGVPSANSTITCWDAAGAIVFSTPMNSLTMPAGVVVAQ